MSEQLPGHIVYVVSFGIQIETNHREIDPDIAREGIFSTEAKAKEYMKELARELYWTHMVGYDFDDDEDEEYPTPSRDSTPPRDSGYNCYYREEAKIIEFGTDMFCDEVEHRSGYVKYREMHIDNVLREPEETSNKKRKA